MTTRQERISVVVLGHLDSGKSTMLSHFLYMVGCFSKRSMEQIEEEAIRMDKPSFKYSLMLDTRYYEKAQGMTIDYKLCKLVTINFNMILIDAPGHRDYLKSTILAASFADAAILMVDSTIGGFESGFASDGQTREHALLARSMGLTQLIVCLNKFDDSSVNYSQSRYEDLIGQLSDFLEGLGYDRATIPFIPTSGWNHENLVEHSQNMPWYKGPTLLTALDNLKPPVRELDKPLRVIVSKMYRIGGIGTVIVGRVSTGVLKVGMDITFSPSKYKYSSTVASIESHLENITEAYPGTIVGLNVRYCNLDRGAVITDLRAQALLVVSSFVAQISIVHHPGKIRAGYTATAHCHSATMGCKWEKILQRIGSCADDVVENPEYVVKGDTVLVKLVPLKPLYVEAFSDFPDLGRIIITHKRIVATGIIKEVERVQT